jgi:alkylation response protein AidB-like acyl-CoA dehydrogenase
MVTITAPNEIRDLLPRIRERREEIERNRQLPQDLVDEMRATGMFRLALPRALGGQEAEPRVILGTIEALSAADGSTGWCAMLAITNGLVGGYMRDAGAREVFADLDSPTAFVFVRRMHDHGERTAEDD